MSDATPTVSRFTVWASFVLTILGVAISTYLTIAHYKGTSFLACSEHGLVNCATVTTSAQSRFLGMPVSDLGLAFFLGMLGLNNPWMWRRSDRWIAQLRALGLLSGMGFVLWLVAAELLIIDHICLWCTGVHIVTFALLLVVSRTWTGELFRRSR